MAKIISLGNDKVQAPQPLQPQSVLPSPTGIAKAGLSGLAQAPFAIGELLNAPSNIQENIIRSFAPPQTPQEEARLRTIKGIPYPGMETAAQIPGVSYQPQGVAETAVQSFGRNLPATLAAPGALAPKLAGEAGSVLAGAATKEAGFGAPEQFLASVLGGNLTQRLYSAFQKAPTFENLNLLAQEAKKQAWQKTDELGKDRYVTGYARRYNKELMNFEQRLKRFKTLPASDKSALLEAAQEAQNDIAGGRLNLKDFSDRTKSINELYDVIYHPRSFEQLKYLRKIVANQGERLKTYDPEWYNQWSFAREIGQAENYIFPGVKKIEEDYPKVWKVIKNPITKQILKGATGTGAAGAAYLYPQVVGSLAAVGVPLGLGAKKLGQLYGFYSLPSTRKLLEKAAQYSAERNIPNLTRVITQLDNSVSKYEQQNPVMGSGKAKIISLPQKS